LRAPADFKSDFAALRRAFDTAGVATKQDWAEWLRRVGIELLRQSPSPHLRPATPIAEVHRPAAAKLFRAAFVALWVGAGLETCNIDAKRRIRKRPVSFDAFKIQRPSRDEAEVSASDVAASILKALRFAFSAPALPAAVANALLGLVEHLQAQGLSLAVDVGGVAQAASRQRHDALAVQLRELDAALVCNRNGGGSAAAKAAHALVEANHLLGLADAAAGALAATLAPDGAADADAGTALAHARLFEQLGRHDDALLAYEAQIERAAHREIERAAHRD